MPKPAPVEDGALSQWESDLKRDAARFGLKLSCAPEAAIWGHEREMSERSPSRERLLDTFRVVSPKPHADGFQPAPHEELQWNPVTPRSKPTRVEAKAPPKRDVPLGRDAFYEGLERQRQALQRLPGGLKAPATRDPGKPEAIHGINPLVAKAEELRRMTPKDRQLTIEAEAAEAEAEKARVRAAAAANAKPVFPHGVPSRKVWQTTGSFSAGVPQRA
jgi:hypothetical protein